MTAVAAHDPRDRHPDRRSRCVDRARARHDDAQRQGAARHGPRGLRSPRPTARRTSTPRSSPAIDKRAVALDRRSRPRSRRTRTPRASSTASARARARTTSPSPARASPARPRPGCCRSRSRAPRTPTVNLQIGPAINGTSLRDVVGFITFNQFVNQVDYADAGDRAEQPGQGEGAQGPRADLAGGQDGDVHGRVHAAWCRTRSRSRRSGWRRVMSAVMRARGVSKVYGATHALRGVDFAVAPGTRDRAVRRERRRQVDADEDPRRDRAADHGRARARRRAGGVRARPREAADRGIVIIHQELSLFPNLSIADNLFMARERGAAGVVVDQQAQREAAARAARAPGGAARRRARPSATCGSASSRSSRSRARWRRTRAC